MLFVRRARERVGLKGGRRAVDYAGGEIHESLQLLLTERDFFPVFGGQAAYMTWHLC